MICPVCDGDGGWCEEILGYGECVGSGPYCDCYLCDTTGKVNIWKYLKHHFYESIYFQIIEPKYFKIKSKVIKLWKSL